ncbi:S4 domain protein [Dictyocaulus viviparus]|uniref:S4 domain protein n=1 Tax=Dictyocaulus viviparus TaxID=29172 RepID=A0A0D8XPU4_DICVI|nr:S4 domain protein [Dictyocaulus viviparus]
MNAVYFELDHEDHELARSTRMSSVIWSQDVDDDGLPKDYKLKTLKTGSRRLDTFVNRASGKSSMETAKCILSGRVRVNENVVTKKSYNVQINDNIDVWIESYPENTRLAEVERYEVQINDNIDVWIESYPETTRLAEVERYEVVNYAVTDKGYDIHIKSWKKFVVDNWRGS